MDKKINIKILILSVIALIQSICIILLCISQFNLFNYFENDDDYILYGEDYHLSPKGEFKFLNISYSEPFDFRGVIDADGGVCEEKTASMNFTIYNPSNETIDIWIAMDDSPNDFYYYDNPFEKSKIYIVDHGRGVEARIYYWSTYEYDEVVYVADDYTQYHTTIDKNETKNMELIYELHEAPPYSFLKNISFSFSGLFIKEGANGLWCSKPFNIIV